VDELPVLDDRARKFIERSMSNPKYKKPSFKIGELVYFHSTHNEQTIWCRGLIRRQPIPSSGVYKVLITEVNQRLIDGQPVSHQEALCHLGKKIPKREDELCRSPGWFAGIYPDAWHIAEGWKDWK
jgi:hypothetical protein